MNQREAKRLACRIVSEMILQHPWDPSLSPEDQGRLILGMEQLREELRRRGGSKAIKDHPRQLRFWSS